MEKRLKITLLKLGSENDLLTKMIANYNSGKAEISPRDLEGYLNTLNAIWLNIRDCKLVKRQPEDNIYSVSEDGGKTFTMTIEWCEIYEIPAIDQEIEAELNSADDLQNVNI